MAKKRLLAEKQASFQEYFETYISQIYDCVWSWLVLSTPLDANPITNCLRGPSTNSLN